MKNYNSILIFLFCVPISSAQRLYPVSNYSIPAELKETSGIVMVDDHYVSHNDSGNEPQLISFTANGELLKIFPILNAKNNDWEDLCADNKGNYYVGDIGNNLNKRSSLCVYKIKLSENDGSSEKINFRYSDQKVFPPHQSNKNFDSEALIWIDDTLYLFSKDNSVPYSGHTKCYKLPAVPGNQIATLCDSFYLGSGGFLEHSVTGAAYDPVKKRLGLLTYKHFYLFWDFNGTKFFHGKWAHFDFSTIPAQREAICFGKKGKLILTEEQRLTFGGSIIEYNFENYLNGNIKYSEGSAIKPTVLKTTKENKKVTFTITETGNYTIEIYKNKIKKEFSLSITTLKDAGKILYEFETGKNSKEDIYYRIFQNNRLIYCIHLSELIK